MKKVQKSLDYNVLTNAISNAALSRRAALQLELSVGLVHFTQENGGADTTGKANLKAIYNGAGYLCMAKADRDYKTVNRRLNACAALFDKFGSSLVNGWVNACSGDTEALLAYVVTELQPYALETMDDVLEYVGKASNKTPRAARPPAGPVTVTTPAANDEGAGEGEGEAPRLNLDQLQGELLAQFNDEELNTFMLEMMEKMAARAAGAATKQAA